MVVLMSIFSVLFDWVDFSLFLFFPSLVNKTFIGMNSDNILFSFAAWAVAYSSRSLGALFLIPRLHKLEDSKRVIVFTGALVLVPSFLIILMPSYSSIGITATFLFIFFRFIQGLGLGVDFPVTIFYVFQKFHSWARTTIVFSFGTIGFLFSFYFSTLLKKSHFIEFFAQGENWRLLFLAVFMLSLASLLLRLMLKKEAYGNFLKQNTNLFQFKTKQFFYNLLLSYLYGVWFYTFFIYLPFFLTFNFFISLISLSFLCCLSLFVFKSPSVCLSIYLCLSISFCLSCFPIFPRLFVFLSMSVC